MRATLLAVLTLMGHGVQAVAPAAKGYLTRKDHPGAVIRQCVRKPRTIQCEAWWARSEPNGAFPPSIRRDWVSVRRAHGKLYCRVHGPWRHCYDKR